MPGGSMPGGMTATFSGLTPNRLTISDFEKAEIVTIVFATLADCLARNRRRSPSRQPNHSGRAANEMSCNATTRGTGVSSGVE